MATLRIECCETDIVAEERRAALTKLGFTVSVVENITVIAAEGGKKEKIIFSGCKFLVTATKP